MVTREIKTLQLIVYKAVELKEVSGQAGARDPGSLETAAMHQGGHLNV